MIAQLYPGCIGLGLFRVSGSVFLSSPDFSGVGWGPYPLVSPSGSVHLIRVCMEWWYWGRMGIDG